MSPKKLLFIPYKLHFRFFLFALARRMSVIVLLPPEKKLPEDSGLVGVPITYWQFGAEKIKRLFGKELRTLKYISGLKEKLSQLDAGILMTCEFYHWYTWQCLSYKKQHPETRLFLVSETKRWPRNVVARLFKWLLLKKFRNNIKYFDGVFVYTEQAKKFMNEQVPEVAVRLLPTPVNLSALWVDPEKVWCRDGTLRLLMSARYSPYKKHEDLFAALSILKRKGKKIRVTCISRDGKNKESVVRLAKEAEVLQSIDFMEPISADQVLGLYHAHDLLVLPSYNEAIGMVVPEAMACGLPTITSDTVGANVYVREGETGLIFETGNIEQLAVAIESFTDAERLATMGQAARHRIEASFTPEAVVKQFLNDLDTMADQNVTT